MSSTKSNNCDQNIVLHIGPQFELGEMNQMKSINNSNNITCCKSSQGKVGVYVYMEQALRRGLGSCSAYKACKSI